MWIYQAVTNVGVQVLVLMGLGYIFARFKLLEQAKFLPQSNFLVLMLALPAFNLYLMGIKLDLQNPEPWKSLAAFLLWVFVVQASTLLYTWRFCAGDAGEAAVINMVLLMDNYAITGLLALNATLGTRWGTLALLMAMGFFLAIFPFSLAAFEWEKWAVQQHVEAIAEAAALDIEAATAAAAAAEAANGDGDGKLPSSDDQPMPPRPPTLSEDRSEADNVGGRGGTGDGVNGVPSGQASACIEGVELALYPAAPDFASPSPPSAAPKSLESLVSGDTVGSVGPQATTQQSGVGRDGANGFPHESRYCWWSNEDYRPAHPLLDSAAAHSSQPVQRTSARPQRQRRRRRDLLIDMLRQQQHRQQESGSYMPPRVAPSADAPTSEGASVGPIISPFQGWPKEATNLTTTQAGAQAQPSSVSPAAAAGRRPATLSNMPSSTSSPRQLQVERRMPSLLVSMFDRLAAAGSGQLPTPLFGDLGNVGAGCAPAESDKPRLQDLEFALTHQLSGGTASQLARISRGYTAAAAAASAAAASPDANVRRLLLASSGPTGRSPLQLTAAVPRQGTGPGAPRSVGCLGPAAPGPARSRTGMYPYPPPSASTGTAMNGPTITAPPLQPTTTTTTTTQTRAVSSSAAVPTTLASLESGDSIGPPSVIFGEGEVEGTADAAAADTAAKLMDLVVCPTFSRQEAVSAAPSSLPASAHKRPQDGEGRLASASMPMFSFGRRSQRRQNRSAVTGSVGTIDAAVNRSATLPSGREWMQRSATDNGQVDKVLLTLASGLALDNARRRNASQRGDRSPPLLVDTDPTTLLQLVSAISAQDGADLDTSAAADKQLVREATKEVVRRHGGLARAFAAFISGHPQLWHIVSTLAKNPMIWTMFVAMTVSVTGLRVFLDPASPQYRPEVGWVAGSLSWINGLVVPISIFSNGAWMYGKPVLPKGELVKMVVLFFIKVGALPLLMAGCALLVKLDDQHVAAMTVLTLSPAAAASFVLAVQYGRGVALVSLTNILGNIFLTPLLIMWLKILAALNISFHLHDDV